MLSVLMMLYGAWQMAGHDPQRTNRTQAVGNISDPKLAWQADMSASEYYLALIPQENDSIIDLPQNQAISGDIWREYGLTPALVDVLQDGNPINPPNAQGERWGKFLPDVKGLQRLSWTTTWGNDAHFQMHSFEDGLENPRLVWDVGFGTMYSPMTIVIDIDGDGSLEVAISIWNGVAVYDLATGKEKYKCMYRTELGRQYGFFGAYTDPAGKTYLVVIGDFAGHIGASAIKDGELKNLWVHEFDTQSTQGIDRRFTINTVCPEPFGDFDGDGHGEILMNLFNNTDDGRWHLMAYDLETGEHRLDLPDVYLKGHVDVDGDGIDELLVQVCKGRPVGTNGEIRLLKWDKAVWSYPYARWSMKNLPELPLTRLTGATRGMESPVTGESGDRKGRVILFTAPQIPLDPPLGKGEEFECLGKGGKSERLYSLRLNAELKPEILWSIESPSGTSIDAVSASGAKTLVRIRAGNEILSVHSNNAKIEPLGKTRLIRDAPQPLVLKDGKGQTQIIVADPMDQVSAWVVEEGKPLKKIWQQKGRAMTTSVPSMLGLTAGDIDGDGVDEVLCVQEMPQGFSRIVAVGLDGTLRWRYDFPDFNGRPPVWNETGTTLWALGHFSDAKRLDVLISNRRSIMHSDETVVINTDKGIIWKKDILEVREPWTDTPWKHTRGYGGGVVAIADFFVDGDGLVDIAMCYPAEYSVVKGSNGEQLGIENTGPLKGTDNFWVIGGSPLIADFNNDGKPETLWASSPIIIAFFHDGIKTDILWRTEPNDGASGLPAFGDTDGDGRCEIGLPGFKDGFRCIDPMTGQTLWNVPQQGEGSSNCVAVDINGDGIEEFVFANGAKLLAVAKRNSADPILWQIDLPSAIQNIVIDDIDGDGKAEILAGGRDGVLYCVI
jgi:hypothetical protein